MGKICKQKEEVKDLPVVRKTRYLKYTIQYVAWTPCIIPVRIYFMDVASCTVSSRQVRTATPIPLHHPSQTTPSQLSNLYYSEKEIWQLATTEYFVDLSFF